MVAIELYRIAETPVLLAIPLFTFAGYLLSESRAPQRLVRLSRALLGWMPGGLALVALVACALFTAFIGASGITIVALGALLVPALRAGGYGENFSLGLVTTSGSLGLLFAPALPLIAQQLGIAGSATVENMFLAGILPGTLPLNLFLLVLGTMLDIFSALVLVVPLLLPVALGYGIHPVHLGIIFLANMQIGYFTPPVGMNLFIASYRFERPVLQLYRATLSWFLILLCALLLISYWPDLSLVLIRGD